MSNTDQQQQPPQQQQQQQQSQPPQPPQQQPQQPQGFFVPDLLTTLPNTFAAIIDQRISALVNQRFSVIEQRLDAIEAILRAGGRLQPQAPASAQPLPVQAQSQVNNDPVLALAAHNAGTAPAPATSSQSMPPPPAVIHALTNIVAMEIPPEGYPISSRASMQMELDQFTVPRGYSMRMSGTRDMGKGKRKIRWICFRAGEARFSDANKASERPSKKCNCPFKFECVETVRDSNLWVVHHHITPGTTVHNHGPSDPSDDPRSRKLPPAPAAEVDSWLKQGWQVNKILTELRNRGFKNVLSRDLYNRRQQLKREEENAAS